MIEHLTIIMIEDDDGHRRLIERNIRRAGVFNPVLQFRTAREGIDYLQTAKGSMLVLLDLNLPDAAGIEVLAFMKSHETLKLAPVIVLTTTDDKEEIRRCYELGCNVYMTKPVDYADFSEAIRQLGLFFSVIKVPDAN